MCSIPSCDIINKTGGPLIVIFKKYILHCTHARSTYCTSTGQEQRSPSNVYTTKKKTKCPHIFNNIRGSFGKSFIFIFFWVFSECVTASYTYTRLSSHAVKVRSGKKTPTAARRSALGEHGERTRAGGGQTPRC